MSWSRNAVEPESDDPLLSPSSSPSRIDRPFFNVWRNRSSSLPITLTMKSRFFTTSGYALAITSVATSTRRGITNFSVPSRYAYRTARRMIRRNT